MIENFFYKQYGVGPESPIRFYIFFFEIRVKKFRTRKSLPTTKNIAVR